MAGNISHTGTGVGEIVKKGVGMVHGSGEAIRGNVNAAVDSATGDREAAARNQNIAARGVDEFQHGHCCGTGAGVTPADRVVQGGSSAGRCSKDMRLDGTTETEEQSEHIDTTNPNSSHAIDKPNKPVTFADMEAAASGLEPAERWQSEPVTTQTAAMPAAVKRTNSHPRTTSHDTPPTRPSTIDPELPPQHFKRCDTMPHLHHNCPDGNGQIGDDYYTNIKGKVPVEPHSSRIANLLDPRVEWEAPVAEPHSTANPHQSGFLNLLDPRVDRKAVKVMGEGESGLMEGREGKEKEM